MTMLLETVKNVVKALSMINPMGIPLRVLLECYKLIEGAHLPYAAFGYSSAENFLGDLSDIVQIDRRNGQLYVHPIDGKEFANINSLMLNPAAEAMRDRDFRISHEPPKSAAPICRVVQHLRPPSASQLVTGASRVPPPVPPRRRPASTLPFSRAALTCGDVIKPPAKQTVHLQSINPFVDRTSYAVVQSITVPSISSAASAVTQSHAQSSVVGQCMNPFFIDNDEPTQEPQLTADDRNSMKATSKATDHPQMHIDALELATSSSAQPISTADRREKFDQTRSTPSMEEQTMSVHYHSKRDYPKCNEIPKYDAAAVAARAQSTALATAAIASSPPKPFISSSDVGQQSSPANTNTMQPKAVAANSTTNVRYISQRKVLQWETGAASPKIRVNHQMLWPIHLDIPSHGTKFIQKMPENAKQHASIRLYVAEINNPYKFWFNYCETADELDTLMYRMDIAYNQMDADEFIIIDRFIQKGQICAAIYMERWHRAEIVGVFTRQQQVKVFFVDYGTVDYVTIKNIRFLKKDFVALPAQAYRGVFDGIKPIRKTWVRDDTIYLQELVSDRALFGTITYVNSQENVLHMILTDPRFNSQSSVNEQMVSSNHARVTPYLHTLPKRLYAEVFPSFEALESGVYPSFAEHSDLAEQEFDSNEYA